MIDSWDGLGYIVKARIDGEALGEGREINVMRISCACRNKE
jgi:hypothetical protein